MNTQERLRITQHALDKRLETQALWEREVRNKPGDQQALDQLQHVSKMVESAKEAVKRAEEAAALAADPTSKQAQAELKRLEKVNKQGAEMTETITQAAKDLHDQMVEWQELRKEAKRLADRYDLKPFDLGIAGSRLDSLQLAVDRWLQEIRSWEIEKWRRDNPQPDPKPKPALFKTEHEKMLAQRYPEVH